MEGAGIELCAVNLPGRRPNEKVVVPESSGNDQFKYFCYLCADVLTPLVAQHIKSRAENIPITIFGHSLGGLMAFDVVQSLEIMERQLHGAVSGSLLNQRLKIVVSAALPPLELTLKNRNLSIVHHTSSDNDLFAHIVDIGGLPTGVHPDFLAAFLPVIRRDYGLYETYAKLSSDSTGAEENAECVVNVPIITVAGAADTCLSPDDMLGWGKCTTASHCHVVMQGSHFYMTELAVKKQFLEMMISWCQLDNSSLPSAW